MCVEIACCALGALFFNPRASSPPGSTLPANHHQNNKHAPLSPTHNTTNTIIIAPHIIITNPYTSHSKKVHAYHEAVSEAQRARALSAFLTPPPAQTVAAPAASGAGADGAAAEGAADPSAAPPPVVLVCTDRTSRGVDTAWCGHVVLFDFPRDPSEYVRRAGRTARGAGGRGVVSALVLGKQVPLARQIIEANQKGRPVHRVPETEVRW